MKGIDRSLDYPMIIDGEDVVVSSKEKAEVIAKTLAKVHSSDNLNLEEKKGREETMLRHSSVSVSVDDEGSRLSALFTRSELNKALRKLRKSAPGEDSICYDMLSNLSDEGKDKLLLLFNKVWVEGVIPRGWKESLIIPIRKPGKDPHSPGSYRPIALTSQVGKTMEKMVNDRLNYWVESKGLLQSYQSGFRRGRGTMDPVVCLEDVIRRAQVNKKTVVAVFFDIEKAYDMLWTKGLLIKLQQLGQNWGQNAPVD